MTAPLARICSCCDRWFTHEPFLVDRGPNGRIDSIVCTAECLARASAEHEAQEERAWREQWIGEAGFDDDGTDGGRRSDADGNL